MFSTTRKQEDSFHDTTYPTPPQLKDNVDKPLAAGDPDKKGPLSLYNAIQQALAARRVWEAKKNETSQLKLEFAEDFVNNVADCYKRKKLLSLNWKYNPATAGSHEPKDDFPSMRRLNGTPIRRQCGPWYLVSYICDISMTPKVKNISLKEHEHESWEQFKKLDEQNFASILGDGWGLRFPVNTENEFVGDIGRFVVEGFNEAFEMHIEKGNHCRLNDSTISKCIYSRRDDLYWFKMTIVADEDGFRGIYEATVTCTVNHGKKTLKNFTLTDVKHGKNRRASKFKSSEGGVGLWLPDIEMTGMSRRGTFYGFTFGGYDYIDPSDIMY